MISTEHVRMMAAYNRWQNESLYRVAGTLDDAARKANRGAHFGSIHATLCHLLFGDQGWMFRFTGDEAVKPEATSIAMSATFVSDWDDLVRRRVALDAHIARWAGGLGQSDLQGDLTYHSVSAGRSFTFPRWLLVTHMFNHQTHHRGQVHAMLTAAGLGPDDTDIPLMPGLPR